MKLTPFPGYSSESFRVMMDRQVEELRAVIARYRAVVLEEAFLASQEDREEFEAGKPC